MAWTPPSAPKHNDLGEMPGIRDLTDAERDRMNANDPNQDGHVHIQRNMQAQDEATALYLTQTYGQLSMDVANFLEAWIEEETLLDDNIPDDYVPYNMFSDTFMDDIKDRLKKTMKTFSPRDVYDIAMYRDLTNHDFYYGVNIDSKTNECYAVITRVDRWEDDKNLDTESLSRYVAPEFLENPVDSRYDIVGDMTPSEVRRSLRKLGFIENLEVAGL